jgi:hypothetical protein
LIAHTPDPINEGFEAALDRKLNKKPNIPKMDIKSLESIPDAAIAIPDTMEEVSTQETEDFLKQMDGGSTEQEPEKEAKKQAKKEKPASKDPLGLDTLDAEETATDKKSKITSKEENIAELRKSFENEVKAREDKLKTYQEKLESLEAELERTAFERSPKFKERYQNPYNEAIAYAAEYAQEVGDDPSLAEKALSLKGKDRADFIDENFGGGAHAAEFLSRINTAEKARNSLEGALSDYHNTYQQIAADEQQSRLQEKETINKNFERIYNHISENSEFFKTSDDPDHNKVVEERKSAARALAEGTASQQDLLASVFYAVIGKESASRISELEAELAKYKSRAKETASAQARINRSPMAEETNEDVAYKGKPKNAMNSIMSQIKRL